MVNFRGEFILVWSSDSLAVSKTQTKPLKFEISHFAVPLLSSPGKHTSDVFSSHGKGGDLGADGFWRQCSFFSKAIDQCSVDQLGAEGVDEPQTSKDSASPPAASLKTEWDLSNLPLQTPFS